MKSVLISIRPKWCELIAKGEKTVEIIKTKPKIETPFKVYIYCTADTVKHIVFDEYGDRQIELVPQRVIGEFVCDKVFLWNHDIHDDDSITLETASQLACLSEDALLDYADGYFYGWHISNLKVYDRPFELRQFTVEGDCDCLNCRRCLWAEPGNGYNVEDDCGLPYEYMGTGKELKPLFRPPQSWCYVEEVQYGSLE